MSPKEGKNELCAEGCLNSEWDFFIFIIALPVKMSIIILLKKYFWWFVIKTAWIFVGMGEITKGACNFSEMW